MRVTMFVYNPLTHDARVFREASKLVELGHTVEIIGRLGGNVELAQLEERDGFTILRVSRDDIGRRMRRRFSIPWGIIKYGLRILDNLVHRRFPVTQLPEEPKEHKPRGWFYRQQLQWDWWIRAYSLARERPADVYHAHDLNTLPAGFLAARRAGAPLIYDSHEIFPERASVLDSERGMWRLIERLLIKRADRMITVSDSFGEYFAERYGIERPLTLLNVPVRTDRLPEGTGNALRERAGIENDEPIVLYQGRVAPERGLEQMVEAAGMIKRGNIVIMGEGNLRPALQRLAEEKGVTDRVKLLDPVPSQELLSYTLGATVGVAPTEGKKISYRLTAPNKLFEYVAAGLPVIATRLPETERLMSEHEVGLLYESGDAKGLAEAIDRLLGDRDLYERLRSNTAETAKLYNWERESDKLVDLYSRLPQTASG